VLAKAISQLLPEGAQILDIGSGNGRLIGAIAELRPDLRLVGLEIRVPHDSEVELQEFDGVTIPFSQDSWDVCMASDVLHHSNDPERLLSEMVRVSRHFVLIKDHKADSSIAWLVLATLDYLGNVGYGTAVPFNFWKSSKWKEAFARQRLGVRTEISKLGIYPPPLSLVLDGNLHFIALLEKERSKI